MLYSEHDEDMPLEKIRESKTALPAQNFCGVMPVLPSGVATLSLPDALAASTVDSISV